jgi:hypothetical protein
MVSRVKPGHLAEQIELLHIGESMLTQIPAENAFAKGVVRRAVLDRQIKFCVEVLHGRRILRAEYSLSAPQHFAGSILGSIG